ncbi:TonB-dependent receptor [Xanthocytophaga flava]|uniref:TonB-dependent receptor n=1 Tax=Xanthocytophaga flava TaxID=3048013 RepID=UPI0028D0880F|nr:TonB-dependent receptor [Xanthocytophaga flavus]MDJ1472585.1 TonB-dependent receptor [Xanthocytophaga flavus]
MKHKLYKLSLICLFALLWHSAAVAQSKTVTGKVTDKAEPLVGVTVVVKGTTTGTVTNEKGAFSIKVPGDDAILIFSSVGYTAQEVAVGSKSEIDVSLLSDGLELSEITVVGSRNANRTQLESVAPVDIISVNQMAQSMPQPDLSQMLKQVAPSFNALQQVGGDLDSHVTPVQLRNQPPNQTLLLLNGKRRHVSSLLQLYNRTGPSTSADLMTIPTLAVEKVEILRDGAAAQYGSDAIAGVMNINLRKSVNELSASYYTSIYKEGDGVTHQLMANYGLPLGKNGGFINMTGEITSRGSTTRTPDGGYDGVVYGDDYLNNRFKDANGQSIITNPEIIANPTNSALLTDDGLMEARGLTRKNFQMINGLSKMTNSSLFFNAGVPLSDKSRFYAFGGINYRNTLSGCYYRFPRQTDRVIYEVYPNGFLPQLTSIITDKSVTAGIQGKLGVFDVDFSNTFGSSKFRYGMVNTLNASYGPESPTTMRLGDNIFTQNTTSLAFSHYFNNPFGSEIKGINLAFGAEMRIENFQITPGQVESYTKGTYGTFTSPSDNYNYTQSINPDAKNADGSDIILPYRGYVYDFNNYSPNCQCFRGFTPQQQADAYRNVAAGYIDVEADLSHKFTISGAARFENYSDFGSVITGKIAARYSILANVHLRGSASTGFRAPSLHELYYAQTSTVFTPEGVPFDVGFFTNQSSAAKALGIPQLKEENSKNVSFGIAFEPMQGFEITADAYWFRVTDKIILTGNFDGPSVGGNFKNVIGAGAAQFFTNGADVESKGLDLVANYTRTLGNSKLILSLAANWNKVEFVAVHPAKLKLGPDATLTPEQISDLYLSRSVRGNYEEGNPRQKYILSATFMPKKWTFMARTIYYGSVWSRSAYADETTGQYYDYKLDGRATVDLSVGYTIFKGLNLSVGGENIFDVYPTRILPALTDSNRFGYENYQMGFQGAYYYARLGFKF